MLPFPAINSWLLHSKSTSNKSPRPQPPMGGGERNSLLVRGGGQGLGRPPLSFQAEEVRHCVHLAEHFGNCSEIGDVLRSQLCNPLETKVRAHLEQN